MTNTGQIDLIRPVPPICRIRLEANSVKHPYYEISIYRLPASGFLIQKRSGAQGSRGVVENWWRPGLRQAIEKKGQLIASKLNKKKGRVYTVISVEGVGYEQG